MPSARPITIFMSAAEASGDMHAAGLITALRRKLPKVRIVGVAGDQMADAGCEVITDLTRQASMLGSAFLKLGYYYRQVKLIKKAIRRIQPDVLVPVDSPALNWHLAATARQTGASVVYYIAPQVWAWGPWRVRKLAKLTDHVACILPFEETYLRHRGVKATYVGHPLLETLPDRADPLPDIVGAWSSGKWKVALLPGSRQSEIQGHSRALLEVGQSIQRRWRDARFTFTARNEEAAAEIRSALGKHCPPDIDIAVGRTREVLAESHFAVAVSGTVTLEVAHFGVPMVIFYKAGPLLRTTYRVVRRWMVPTRHLSLVNILAGKRVVPELMPWNGRPSRVIEMVSEVMDELGYLCEMRRELLSVVDSLHVASRPGDPSSPASDNASDNTADIIIDTLRRRGRL